MDEPSAKVWLTVFCAVINKPAYMQRYGPTRPVDQFLPTNLYAMALDFVLERFVKFLEAQDSSAGSILAESRGRAEDAQVGAEYQELLSRGNPFLPGERFSRVHATEITFVWRGTAPR